ncbi:MAG: helix-turn-helix domain-containing protein [Clostridia bacterium]|nr:helix-turn-helix domain-containing protein [Clostridia bacterium]
MKTKGYGGIAGMEKLSPEEIKERNREFYGSRIKAYRIRAGLSAEQLAEALHLSKSSVRNWECGLTRPDPEFLYRMFGILQMEPNEFFGIREGNGELSSREKELIRIYRGLDSRGQMDLEGMAEMLAQRMAMREMNRIYREYEPVACRGRCLSAGSLGDDWADRPEEGEILLRAEEAVKRADEVMTVSGESMEPQFCDGDRVLIEFCGEIRVGDIGAFYVPGVGGVIKQKMHDRLHSLNPAYDDIFPYEEGARLIGRVIGTVKKGMIADAETEQLYREAAAEREKNPEFFDAFSVA